MYRMILGIALGIALAFTLAGEAPVLAQRSPAARSSIPAMKLDGCPYYPSQALCRMRPSPTTTGNAMPQRTVPASRKD